MGKSAPRLSSSIGLAQVSPKTEIRVSTFLASMSCRTRMYSEKASRLAFSVPVACHGLLLHPACFNQALAAC
jgi:hypothetical protein